MPLIAPELATANKHKNLLALAALEKVRRQCNKGDLSFEVPDMHNMHAVIRLRAQHNP